MASLDFSVYLGYASIFFWLGAQFPQVVENIRRRSCDGLSLPFLANWLLGDISNLIGCILTNQLPFQTWLAVYFVTVDMSLCCQYFYYEYINPHRTRPRLRRMSVDRRYRTLSVVASNVAAAAALAAQHDEQFAPSRRGSKRPQSSRETFFESPVEDNHTEGDFSALSDSVHSEGGLTFGGKKRVSWSRERQRETLTRSLILPASHSEHTADSSARGRTLQRDTSGEVNRVLPSVSVGRSSRISKQSPSMVFLGVFAIFGLGSLFSPKHVTSLSSKIGSVLVPRVTDASYSAEHSTVNVLSIFSNNNDDNNFLILSSGIPTFEPQVIENSNERVIGRIFAWVCTTLYLTSRLPQIWKNYVRKSVEGLSIYLFVFAFLGNVFYVASILTSPEVSQPPPASSHFIKESIPYLLGSGGTLVFDMSIVTQSFIYRSKHRRRRSRSRTATAAVEEEGGLLAGDVLAQSHASLPQEEVNVHSRTRNPSSN